MQPARREELAPQLRSGLPTSTSRVRWTPASALSRGAELLRTQGFRSLWYGALAETCYRRLLVLERPLDEPPPHLETGVAVEVSRLEDPREYRQLRPDTSEQEFLNRLRRGMECFMAHCEGQPVSANWTSPGGGPVAYLRRDVEFEPDDVYLLDSYTRVGFRGKGLAPAVAVAQMEHYRRVGKRRLIALVLPENRASLRARARTGFRVCGVIGYVGIGGLRREFLRASRRPMP